MKRVDTRWLDRFERALARNLTRAANATAKEGVKIGRQDSQGRLKVPQLARLGHPYANVYTGGVTVDDAIINKQSGGFLAGWTHRPASLSGGVVRAAVANASYPAQFLARRQGTKYARPRPIAARVRARLREVARFEAARAIRRSVPK